MKYVWLRLLSPAIQSQYCLTPYVQLLALVPHPVHAVVLLFPIDDALEAVKKEEDAKTHEVDPTVFWMKQTVRFPRFCGSQAYADAQNRSEMLVERWA